MITLLLVLVLSACDLIEKSEVPEDELNLVNEPFPGDHKVVLDNLDDSYNIQFTDVEYTELSTELCFTMTASNLNYGAGKSNNYFFVVHKGSKIKSTTEYVLRSTSINSRYCFENFSDSLEYRVDFGLSLFTDIILIDGFTSQSNKIRNAGKLIDQNFDIMIFDDFIKFDYFLGNYNLNFESVKIIVTNRYNRIVEVKEFDDLVADEDFYIDNIIVRDLTPGETYNINILFTGSDAEKSYDDLLIFDNNYSTLLDWFDSGVNK